MHASGLIQLQPGRMHFARPNKRFCSQTKIPKLTCWAQFAVTKGAENRVCILLPHFTASILKDLGVPIGVIQSMLGHENPKTTEIYLQTVNQSDRRAMEKLDGLDIIAGAPIRNDNGPTNPHKEFWHRKVKRPPLKILKRDVAKMGYRGTGRKYGVSDNAIRKWIKVYEIGIQVG